MSKVKIDKGQVLVGSDFEMLVVDTKTNKLVSAIPILRGTKDEPEKTEKDGCCTQHDGVLAECNVPPVRLDEVETFIDNVKFVKDFIKNNHLKKGQELLCCATGEFEPEQLLDPEASQIGCSADYDAWRDGDINEKPDTFPGNMRSTGDHFHFSYPDADVEISINLMKLFDLFVTVPFLFLDDDKKRRELYGKAGAFRLQNWGEAQGFEARTLSGYCFSNAELIRYAFNQINQMFDYYNDNDMTSVNGDADKIVKAINEYDLEIAKELCSKYNINLLLLPEEGTLQEIEIDDYGY